MALESLLRTLNVGLRTRCLSALESPVRMESGWLAAPSPAWYGCAFFTSARVFLREAGDSIIRDPLKLGLVLGSDRKLSLGTVVHRSAVEQRQLADEVIEGGTEVVNAVAEDHAPPQWRRFADLKPLDPFPGFRIEISPREVGLRVLVGESPNLMPEDIELLLRPVELGDHAS